MGMPMLFVTMLLTMLYNAFVFTYMPAAGISFNSPTSIIFHAFIFLVMASFARAASTDPGHIPPGPEWSSKGQPPPEVQERKRCTGEPRWCRKSNVYKPDRAHFCRVLGRVVLRMDHHCPWLGNTVGFANHKYFFLFLLYTNVACSFLGVNIIELLVHLTLPALTTFLLIGAEGLALLLCPFIGPFISCVGIGKKTKTRKPAAVRPRKIRVVRCHGGSSSGESNNTVVSSSGSEAFAGMRRAGLASNFFDD